MGESCTVYKTVDFIGKRWTLLILLELYKAGGSMRYTDIKNSLQNITPKMLSSRLKELQKQGLVLKKIDTSAIPIKSFYSLTPSGIDFIRVIKDIKRWALKWKVANKECAEKECKYCDI